MLYKRTVVWLCVMVLYLCACSTTDFSVTLENEISVSVRLLGTTWSSVTWQIDGVSYTATDEPTANEPVIHLVSDGMPTITVQLPNDMSGTVVFTILTEDGTTQVYTAPARDFAMLLNWCGEN